MLAIGQRLPGTVERALQNELADRTPRGLRGGGFLEAFRAKGRYRDWLTQLPVAVCLAEDAALLGALREARRLAATA